MPATIVVGGQYGSEGKGKVVALIARRSTMPWIVRCGGPNSGHTVTIDGEDTILRQVPCSTTPQTGMFCLSAGCIVDEELVCREADLLGIERQRIVIDPRAVLVTEQDRELESRSLTDIGSTCSGTGAATARRMARGLSTKLAGDSSALSARCRIELVAPLLHDALDEGRDVIVEGTQGFALSLYHGPDYPYVTSRDTTASGFAMEAGLSPRHVERIVMVVRTFPIRVGGKSGPFADEITWEEVARLGGAHEAVPEFTSVTHRLRRVARFDLEAVKRACAYNRPTGLAIMGLDRLDRRNGGCRDWADLSSDARGFVEHVRSSTDVPVDFVGTGFATGDAIDLSGASSEAPAPLSMSYA